MTNRQRAEIQLEGILNDPEASLPAFARRASDQFTNDKISIEEAAKILNTQPFLLGRLVNSIYNSDKKELNGVEVQKLTRVLNGTMDVRALLFFMLLDENNDHYISNTELTQFYETYLKDLKSFDDEHLQEVIQALLHKFHLDEVKIIKFYAQRNFNFFFFRNHELILKNSSLLFPKIRLYLNHYPNLLFIRHGLLNLNQNKKKTNFNDFLLIFVRNKNFMNNRKIN